MILVNGKLQNTLEITDRGLHYGDGLFETIAVIQRTPVFLAQHLARLKEGCQVLKIPYPDENLLLDEITQLSNTSERSVIKLILTRGSGGRGYRQPDLLKLSRIIALHPFPGYPESYKTQGILARFCNTRLGLNPLLAGLKHNNRLEQVLARAEWQDEVQEGLMLNLNEHVIEGTMSNLFVVKEQKLYTPEITVSGIKGVMRQLILTIAAENQMSVQETNITKEFVLDADEIFVSNSIIDIWPIKSLENNAYPVGPITQKVMAKLAVYKVSDISHDIT